MTLENALRGLAGGALVGLSASAILLLLGRIAGVSGILTAALMPREGQDGGWRVLFLLGLLAGGVAVAWLRPGAIGVPIVPSAAAAVGTGFLVGAGVELGAGCTSGHRVCGISRGSPRSLVATAVFLLTGAASVFVARHVIGGGP